MFISIVFTAINVFLPMAGERTIISPIDVPFLLLTPLVCSLIPFFPRPASIAYSVCWLTLLITPHAYVSDMIVTNLLFHFFLGRFRPRKKVAVLFLFNEAAYALTLAIRKSTAQDIGTFLFNLSSGLIFITVGVTVCQAEKYWKNKARATEQRLNEVRDEIAKEMHDLVAYSMSQTVLRARLSAENLAYPQEARDDFSTLAGTGADALHELRILLYALRKKTDYSSSSDIEASRHPHQSIEASMRLVTQDLHDAGFQIECHVADGVNLNRGQTSILSRVLREMAANIIRHGDPAKPASLLISQNRQHIQLLSANSVRESRVAPLPSSGMGILGMQERLAALDGALTTSNEDGTWLVSAIIPLSSITDKEHTV
ncbi:hypothetical protein BKH25_08025 [Actinomyces naeslundii]|nr:hypothetical protein BKH25_08025 [Actinomyces naeslundii]